MQAVRIESEEGIVREEKGTARSHADIELYSVITVPVSVVVPCRTPRPSGAISDGFRGLARPSRVVHAGGNGVRRRRHRQQIGDHYLIESDQGVLNLPFPF